MSNTPNNNAPPEGQSATRVSERFCAADSDITLQSSDGVLFKVHRKNLEFHSESFAAANDFADASTSSEVVLLSESSAVLDLLLQFMYRQRQPDLGGVDFDILAELAEAAEKHEVYAAMTVCNLYMGFATKSHPAEVLRYAYKHDYPKLMDEAAPLTLDVPVSSLVACWASIPGIMMIWVIYHRAWQDVLDFALKLNKNESELYNHPYPGVATQPCAGLGVWGKARAEVVCILGANPGTLRDLQDAFDAGEKLVGTTCAVCKYGITLWRHQVQARVNQLPKFSTLL